MFVPIGYLIYNEFVAYYMGIVFAVPPLHRACYWAMRYDGKARVECNEFDRWYSCTYICESCLSQRKTKNADMNMFYCDFRDSSPRHLTKINDALYRRTCKTLSPYSVIPGWSLGTCLRDILHVLYLGTAKDLVPSLLIDWIDHGLLGGPHMSLEDKLRSFSLEMHGVFRRERLLVWFFTMYSSPRPETCSTYIL